MAVFRKYSHFSPSPEQMALWPKVSGNVINGVGEREKRRADHVYWHDPEAIDFGLVQKYFYQHNQGPELDAARRRRQAAADALTVEPVRAEKAVRPAADFARDVKAWSLDAGAEDVGIARLDPAWIYADSELDLPWVIVFAIAMDFDRLSTAPEVTAGVEVVDQYSRAHVVAVNVANRIRALGYEARTLAGPMAGPMLHIPAALAAGLGELGKHGSVIHPKLGSSFRLSSVATDMPLQADGPANFGADDFCLRCQACTNACPTDAISSEKQWVRGEYKWYVDFDRCLPFFNETAGCGACLPACPWSKPGIAEKLLKKLA